MPAWGAAMLLVCSVANGQTGYSTLSSESPPPAETLKHPWTCTLETFAPEWYCYQVNVQITVDGNFGNGNAQYGCGDMRVDVGHQVPAQIYDQNIGCISSTPFGTFHSPVQTQPGSGPNAAGLKISAFIRYNWVDHPTDSDRIFGGDFREFDPYDVTSRAVTIYDILNPAVNTENEVGPPYHAAGLAQEYEYGTSLTFYPFGRLSSDAINDWQWGPPRKTRWAEGGTSGMRCDPIQRLGIDGPTASNRVRCVANVPNPLVTNPFTPGFDWDLTFTMRWGERKIRVTVTGCRDGYPSYEAYINGRTVFAVHDDGNIFSLFPPCEASVNATVEIDG